jgi:CheY-like chemotaxis protein
MPISDLPADATAAGIRVLLADDHKGVRTLLATLLRATAGVGSVIEANDGAEAVELGCEQRLDVAALDLSMPHLDGVEVAIRLHALQPSLRIALHSSDPELLRRRAGGLELPLFDKIDFDRLLEWVERQARDVRAAGERDVRLASTGAEGRPLLFSVQLRHRQSHAACALSDVRRGRQLDRATRLELAPDRAPRTARRLNAGRRRPAARLSHAVS